MENESITSASDENEKLFRMSNNNKRRPSTFVQFKEEGEAKLVFPADFNQFDGVLINSANDSFILKGRFTEPDKGETGLTCSVVVVDQDAGAEFNIENVAVLFGRDSSPRSDLDSCPCQSLPNSIAGSSSSVIDGRRDSASSSNSDNSVNGDSINGMHQHRKALKAAVNLHSSSLEFDTERVLVGNRADKEINRFVNPNLVGQGSIVCTGRMKIDVCKKVALHKAFSARRMSKEFYQEIDAIKLNDFQL